MRREVVIVCLVVSVCLLWGCGSFTTGPGSGTNYWLIYKTEASTAPGSVYTGYFESKDSKLTDEKIKSCVNENECEGVKKILSADKPPLTDRDQAKVVLFKPLPNEPEPNLAGLECKITQTKITRVPYLAYKDTTPGPTSDAAAAPSVFFCDLSVTDAGGMRLDYTIRSHTKSGESVPASDAGTPPPPRSTLATDRVNDSIEVHTLYRFRILAGPVHSSLSDRERTFTAKPHSGGNSFIGSDVTGNPINAVIFLKYYWQPRDVYDTKGCWNDKDMLTSCLERINPIVGVNVSDNPLNSVYLGMSVDILPGLDLVGGVHWASIEKLSGGFSQGQIVPSDTSIATEKRFLPGWFAGIAVDLGVVGSWLGKATMGILK